MTGDTAGSVPVRRRSWWSIVVLAVLMMLGVIVATLVVIALIPLRVGDLGAQPRPTATYDEAVAAFDAYGANESALGVVDDCHSRLFNGGERTQNVVVLFHGLTNCPQQMVQLAVLLANKAQRQWVQNQKFPKYQ